MAAIGGDITEINFSNDEVGSGTLRCKAGETSTFDLGGFRNETTTDGAGGAIVKKNRAPWMFEVTASWDMNTRQDMEALVKLAESLSETTWDITHVNGSVYSGVGNVEGDLQGDGGEGTIALSVKGGGKLQRQA